MRNAAGKPNKNRSLSVLFNTLLAVAAVFAILCILLAAAYFTQARIFGYQLVRVETANLEPSVRKDAMMLTREAQLRDLYIGDVIRCTVGGRTCTVLVQRIDGERIYVTGTASLGDTVIDQSQLQSKEVLTLNWTASVYHGIQRVMTQLKTPQGIIKFLVLPLCALLLLVAALAAAIHSHRKKQRIKQRQKPPLLDPTVYTPEQFSLDLSQELGRRPALRQEDAVLRAYGIAPDELDGLDADDLHLDEVDLSDPLSGENRQ